MSSLLYLTTRAPGSAALAAPRRARRKTKKMKLEQTRCQFRFMKIICHSSLEVDCLRIPIVELARNRLRRQYEPRQHACDSKRKERGTDAKLPRDLLETGDHRGAPAKTSRPFSKPWASNASLRFWLSYGSFV